MTFVPELVECDDETAVERLASHTAGRLNQGQSDWAESDDVPVAPPGGPVRIEQVTTRSLIAYEAAWSDLAERALEHNVFLDPAFALPLLQHVRFGSRPDFLLAWEARPAPAPDRLIGLLPLTVPGNDWSGRPRIARGYAHPQITLGTPLLDRVRGCEVFTAMLAWLGHGHPHLSALLLKGIPTLGSFCMDLETQCAALGLAIARLGVHERAVLYKATADRPSTVSSILASKRGKELRRQRRRLADDGVLTYRSATTPADIRGAAERFLALEAHGWKGRRGTALLAEPTLATFTRTMTRLMAHAGRCRIDSLDVNGVPVAMGIVVMAGSHAHFWKTTFDERFASRSPGVQFALELTALQQADRGVTLTDSCAVPDHPMIDRLWDDRMEVADVMIALRPGSRATRRFATAVRFESARRRCRALAKSGLAIVRQFRRSRDTSH